MKTFVTAAVVALVVSASTAAATTWINGRMIRPHSIPANRLTRRALISLRGRRGPQGPAGPAGPQGIQGPFGPAGPNGPQGMGVFAYPNPDDPSRCVDIYQEIHEYTDLQVLVDTICAPKGNGD